MNRAERRRLKIKNKVPTYNLNADAIQTMKNDAIKSAVDQSFFLMLAIPVMVMHDKYGKLMKKVDGGKSREERFLDEILELYDTFQKGYVSLEDLHNCLIQETGVEIAGIRR